MVLDLAARKAEREERMKAKRDAISAQAGDTTPAPVEAK